MERCNMCDSSDSIVAGLCDKCSLAVLESMQRECAVERERGEERGLIGLICRLPLRRGQTFVGHVGTGWSKFNDAIWELFKHPKLEREYPNDEAMIGPLLRCGCRADVWSDKGSDQDYVERIDIAGADCTITLRFDGRIEQLVSAVRTFCCLPECEPGGQQEKEKEE